ncbi:Xyloglucan endotransglucosylase/hydrolase protein 9 [Acorus calamus]|uniref:Xyloglucan endotransglucosylase/hydrolase n=1 Tax=Acorus calamus TaxID=4465 RepID=A0AAV9E9X7_ACOCL|nr:Xyloglucan endotransglucosylase/hydrolase protein 9 [Acorus calamus]
MAISGPLKLFYVFITLALASNVSSSKKFDELFQSSWASDHLIYEGELLKLKLDNYSGAGFASKSKYMYGKTTAHIKLVEGDSAGTVTAFYMSSDGPSHHEFDFEFLGNTTGEPYLVQTNIYIDGVGNREQRMDLWFDPTADFHSYSILYNQRQVVFMVDETPIRVHKQRDGVPFPKDQAMGVYSSIWNADDWATQGGRVKTDWSHAPFVTTYREVEIDGCECATSEDLKRCSGSTVEKKGNWWDEPVMAELSVHQSHQLMWVRANHLVYDYCADGGRFPVLPPECKRRRG